MSDLFSIASGAVGVISLGLQVCGKIVSYTQALQGRNDDIQNLATKAEDIRSSLKHLRELIEETRDTSPDFASDLESKALGLQVHVERLRVKADQYKPVATETTHSKTRSTLRKAVYPLKKEALFEIGDCLDGMQTALQTALAISSARKIHQFYAKQDQLFQKIETLELALTNFPVHNILQQPPSRVKELCDDLSDDGGLTLLPRTRGSFQRKQVKKRFNYYNTWFRFFVTGTFSFSTGSGGISIAPSLRISTIVARYSWLGQIYVDNLTKQNIINRSSFDSLIQHSRHSFSVGNFAPTDLLLYGKWEAGKAPSAIIDIPFKIRPPRREDFPAVRRFVKYMLYCHATIEHNSKSFDSFLPILCNAYVWTEAELMLIPDITERAGPIDWAPRTWFEKRNMQALLRRDEDCISLPAAYLAVLRESHHDLQEILRSKVPFSEKEINGISLLQLAMGWPDGVRLLLLLQGKSNTQLEIPGRYHLGGATGFWMISDGYGVITDEDIEIDEYVDSCNILLEAGYTIAGIHFFAQKSSKLRLLFLYQLANRRKKLLELSNAQIPPSQLSEIRKGWTTGLPDAQAYRLCDALMAKGIEIDNSLKSLVASSIYQLFNELDTLKEAYKVGFTDVDQELPEGHTPLMHWCKMLGTCLPESTSITRKGIAWLISRGADPFKKLPGSNTKAIHLLSANLARSICYEIQPVHTHSDRHYLTNFAQIENHIFTIEIKDDCFCLCSVDGCTTLSVALRDAVWHGLRLGNDIAVRGPVFRQFLQFLIEHNQSNLQSYRAIIRSLTFDGLGLSHTCCTECRLWTSWGHSREDGELREIMDEEKELLKTLEVLVADFESQFDADRLSLMDFLQGTWYRRMIRFLSHHDPFDEAHHKEVGKHGVSLELYDVEIPFVVQLIGGQVRVVEDSDDSDDSS